MACAVSPFHINVMLRAKSLVRFDSMQVKRHILFSIYLLSARANTTQHSDGFRKL